MNFRFDLGGLLIDNLTPSDFSRNRVFLDSDETKELKDFLNRQGLFVNNIPIGEPFNSEGEKHKLKTEFFEITCGWAESDIQMDNALTEVQKEHKNAFVDDWKMIKKSKEAIFIMMKICWTEDKE